MKERCRMTFHKDCNDIFDGLKDEICNIVLEEAESEFLQVMGQLRNQKVNILVVGTAGSGKSSTISAIFTAAKESFPINVGTETETIQKYELDNLILWDTPGLGVSEEADKRHISDILKLLNECDSDGNALIDLVLVILDGGSRDLGVVYDLINSVLSPAFDADSQRILIAINQCDRAMKGHYWNYEKSCPELRLEKFLKDKTASVRQRIKDSTGVDTEPIYYSAGCHEEEEIQKPYNLMNLLYYIIKHIPTEKRRLHMKNTTTDSTDLNIQEVKQKDFYKPEKEDASTISQPSITSEESSEVDINRLTGVLIGAVVGGIVIGMVSTCIGEFAEHILAKPEDADIRNEKPEESMPEK